MQDGIIKGTGNGRYLKSIAGFLEQYPTYEAFAEALVAGNLPVDFNGINELGWEQLGTALNKGNLLSDETAALYGLGPDGVPDEVLAHIAHELQGPNVVKRKLLNSAVKVDGVSVSFDVTSLSKKHGYSLIITPKEDEENTNLAAWIRIYGEKIIKSSTSKIYAGKNSIEVSDGTSLGITKGAAMKANFMISGDDGAKIFRLFTSGCENRNLENVYFGMLVVYIYESSPIYLDMGSWRAGTKFELYQDF